ncbi:MAG: heavy-metal-associated domain-containing protein [Gemmatimonadaceae bacterium]
MTASARDIGISLRVAAFAVAVPTLALGVAPRPGIARIVATAAIADTQRVTIRVAGMFCESCQATVHAMLKRSRGVYSARVDVSRGLAMVVYDPARTTPQALADVINRLGYKATLPPASKPATPGQ